MKKLLIIGLFSLTACSSLPNTSDVADVVLNPAHLNTAYTAYINQTNELGIAVQCIGCHVDMSDSIN